MIHTLTHSHIFLLYLKNKLYLCSRKVDRFVMIATTEK